jgi:hypothetical protein
MTEFILYMLSHILYILFCEISQHFYTFALYWLFLYYTPDGRATETCNVRIILVSTRCVERNIKEFGLLI